MANYRELTVFQRADELAMAMYRLTEEFPKAEKFGLTSQLRRAALSVPTNIVEGCARRGQKELAHFISISLGSLAETEYLFSFAMQLGYVKDIGKAEKLIEETGRLLTGFYRAVRSKN